jgi:hypothetical protein
VLIEDPTVWLPAKRVGDWRLVVTRAYKAFAASWTAAGDGLGVGPLRPARESSRRGGEDKL